MTYISIYIIYSIINAYLIDFQQREEIFLILTYFSLIKILLKIESKNNEVSKRVKKVPISRKKLDIPYIF
jgi:hypothetical protein